MDRLKADTRFSAIVQQSALLGDCVLSVTRVLISNGKKAEGNLQACDHKISGPLYKAYR